MMRFSDISITKKLIIIMAIMAILITTELVALSYTIKIFSAVRSYVGGEGLWSKAQKNAAYYLVKYSYTRNPKDYQYYLDFLTVPLSDHQSRIALSQTPLDYEKARQGFLGGRIHPDDIDGIIWLFSTFNKIYYINKAIKVWTEADALMGQFVEVGKQLHLSISNNASQVDIEKQLTHIDELNNQLTAVEDEFSYSLGQASRWLENVIFKLLISIAVTVEFTGIFLTILTGVEISRSINAMNRVAQKVARSDFSERVLVTSKDEIGQLGVSFNTMIDELDQNLKHRHQLENKFKSILEGAPDAMVITSSAGEILMVNVETEKMFGYTRAEMIGKHVDYLMPERYRRKNTFDKAWFADPAVKSIGPGTELHGLRKNGNEFPVEISISPVETEEGILTLSAIRDITDKKEIEVMLIEKNIQLENANVAKDQFLSHMSHELRTPLNGIITMTQLLATSELTEDQRTQLDIITESEEQLLFVINQILDFSKIKSGAIEVEKAVFNLRELVKKILSVYEVKAKTKNLSLTHHIDAEISELYIGDQVKIIQVLSNLLDNAIKFTNSGSIDVTLSLHSKNHESDFVLFEVSDTGIGITDKIRSRLFESFSQGDFSMTRRYGGTGLGLAISKGLVEAMGGSIDVEADENGSRFYFTVPLKETKAILHGQETFAPEVRDAVKPKAQDTHILLAEDNKLNQKTLKMILEDQGYKVTVASDGLEALDALNKASFDLVLMDCQMPNMDGYAATKEIRKKEQHRDKNIPIIGVTAHALESDRQKCLDAGMNNYISKPFNIHDLYKLIKLYLKA